MATHYIPAEPLHAAGAIEVRDATMGEYFQAWAAQCATIEWTAIRAGLQHAAPAIGAGLRMVTA